MDCAFRVVVTKDDQRVLIPTDAHSGNAKPVTVDFNAKELNEYIKLLIEPEYKAPNHTLSNLLSIAYALDQMDVFRRLVKQSAVLLRDIHKESLETIL